jgi:hypothetical protein
VVVQAYNPSTLEEAEAGRSPEFQASLGYIVRPCFKKTKQKAQVQILVESRIKSRNLSSLRSAFLV